MEGIPKGGIECEFEMFVWNLENNSKVDFIPGSHTSGIRPPFCVGQCPGLSAEVNEVYF